MKYTLPKFTFATAALFSLIAAPNAQAEPSNLDQKIRKLMNFEPTNGTIFLEVNLADRERPGPKHCQSISVKIKSDEGVTNTVYVESAPMLFGKILDGAAYGGAGVIAAGNHVIDRIACDQGGTSSFNLKGPFAKLTVQAGQMVNLGSLQVVYEIHLFAPNKGDWRVTDISARAAASMAQRYRETFPKAKKQYMTAIRAGSK